MEISVVIPAFNAAKTLGKCLDAFSNSTRKPKEIIVVNDNSTDNTLEIANHYETTILHNTGSNGANICRNMGANAAIGDIVLFIDSDIKIHPDTIEKIHLEFSDSSTTAVVGCYSAFPEQKGILTKYKNLWIRYSYLQSQKKIDWIFGAVSAIKTDVFKALGGFNADLHAKHGVDDLEFGKRLISSGYIIILNKEVEVDHLKEFTFKSFVKNEFMRSLWFITLAGEFNQVTESVKSGFVNIYPSFILSTLLSWPTFLFIIMSLFFPNYFIIPLIFLVVLFLLNYKFLKYFTKIFGVINGLISFFVLFLDYLVCTLGSLLGVTLLLFNYLASNEK
ncbi:MAG: glycosyltransferase [Bacteroidetes bacterium]|nr:glycosyltransferase [Bacteroidota bacterium]